VGTMVAFTWELLLSIIAPPRCAACGCPADLMAVFCPPCAAMTVRLPMGGRSELAAFAYGGSIAWAIARFKYEQRPDLGRPLGDLLTRAISPLRDELAGALVIPVPLHPHRLAERGYNQSCLLAARVARGLGARMRARALSRTRPTASQATLDRAARGHNVENAFFARNPQSLRGERVLLIDDVRTTGKTLDACTRALVEAGVSGVAWAVLAQADGEPSSRASDARGRAE